MSEQVDMYLGVAWSPAWADLNLSNPGSSYMKTALVSIEVIAVLGGRSQVIVVDPNESIDSFKSHSNSPGMAFCNGSSKLPAFVTVTSDIPL